MRSNHLTTAPPYAVEKALTTFGHNLRTARLRRNLTIQEVADKIDTGPRAVMDAEKGKISAGIGTYIALLWCFDLLDDLYDVANPDNDKEGQVLAAAFGQEYGRERAREKGGIIDDDF
ncbi:MAG: hypothetical protein CMF50_01365 [Legionellales bacterium]|nr:hypothetical protein [Legionellales bacterium]|tara:strand:- start:41137 stop:41490 length:354 start_codon:yes stop_codon:yes gene_type:complete